MGNQTFPVGELDVKVRVSPAHAPLDDRVIKGITFVVTTVGLEVEEQPLESL